MNSRLRKEEERNTPGARWRDRPSGRWDWAAASVALATAALAGFFARGAVDWIVERIW